MNVLIVNSSAMPGAMESHSVTLASALLKKKQSVHLACLVDSPLGKNALAQSIPLIHFSPTRPGDIKAVLRLRKIVYATAADVLIANLGKDHWPATAAAKLAGKQLVLIGDRADRLKKMTRWFMSNHAGRIVAVSRFVRDGMVSCGIPLERIQVIHNAVDFGAFTCLYSDREQTRKKLGIEADDLVIGFAGAMTEEKGVFELLKAFYALAFRHPRLKLLYVGEGPDMEDLKKEARVLRGRVIFSGHGKDIISLYAAMDIFVLPSICREAFGMVLVEAMSMGKPVIATRTGGIPEIIEHRKNGLLVPPGDHFAIARAISELICTPALREDLAINAIESVALKFSDDVFGDSFIRLLKEVCNA